MVFRIPMIWMDIITNTTIINRPPLPFYRNETLIGQGLDQRYLTKMYTEEAVRQIKNSTKDQPFFMYLAHNMPHEPLYVSEKFKGRSKLGLYGDVIMELDWSLGELVKVLKDKGIFDNTLFVFTSDNGPRVGSAKPLRGFKAETWEGGQRVPAIISWPNEMPKGVESDAVLSTLDLFPTLAKVAGYEWDTSIDLDGIELTNFLHNPVENVLKERPFYYFARNGALEAVRIGKWKLHVAKSQGWNKKEKGVFPIALYNLDTDISEEKNLVKFYPKTVERLQLTIDVFEKSLDN